MVGCEYSGCTLAGGATWTVLAAEGREAQWITEVDGVSLLITGSGDGLSLHTLAEATPAGETVPG